MLICIMTMTVTMTKNKIQNRSQSGPRCPSVVPYNKVSSCFAEVSIYIGGKPMGIEHVEIEVAVCTANSALKVSSQYIQTSTKNLIPSNVGPIVS